LNKMEKNRLMGVWEFTELWNWNSRHQYWEGQKEGQD
jgi:hypothetical protein